MTDTAVGTGAIPAEARDPNTVLEVRDVKVHFPVRGGGFGRPRSFVRAVDGVSLTLGRGRTLGLVGESGCGKSTLGRTVVGLIRPTGGQVLLEGEPLLVKSVADRRRFARVASIVFQDPYASLNPRLTVGEVLYEPFRIHSIAPGDRIKDLLEMVGLREADAKRKPSEFSGGQRQRIGIARALALDPSLLVLDEPVSALDVSIQAQILNLLRSLQQQLGLTYLMISHDLSVVREVCDDVAVMYLGRLAEYGVRDRVFEAQAHPYTRALVSAVPEVDAMGRRSERRIVLRGDIPSPSSPPSGCRFRTRCWKATDHCAQEEPTLDSGAGVQHGYACFYPEATPAA